MQTREQTCPETLLAAIGAFLASRVILPPATHTKKRPFQQSFPVLAHRQSYSSISCTPLLVVLFHNPSLLLALIQFLGFASTSDKSFL